MNALTPQERGEVLFAVRSAYREAERAARRAAEKAQAGLLPPHAAAEIVENKVRRMQRLASARRKIEESTDA